jgi:hypothetical protein
MSALSKIRTAGFQLSLLGNSFQIEPADKLTTTQVEFLRSHKAAIIDELAAESTRPVPRLNFKLYDSEGSVILGNSSDTKETLATFIIARYGDRLEAIN